MLTATIIIYALSAGVGGFVSARLYRQLGGLNWVWNTILNALIFPAPLMAVFSFVNTVAIINTSTAALPVGTILVGQAPHFHTRTLIIRVTPCHSVSLHAAGDDGALLARHFPTVGDRCNRGA